MKWWLGISANSGLQRRSEYIFFDHANIMFYTHKHLFTVMLVISYNLSKFSHSTGHNGLKFLLHMETIFYGAKVSSISGHVQALNSPKL